jgi:hypothetical protein
MERSLLKGIYNRCWVFIVAIGTIKALSDLFVALFNERKRHKTVKFDKHISPCYESAKRVFDDYTTYYNKLEQDLSGETSLFEILLFVKARRFEALSNREEVRAIFKKPYDKNLEPFDKAILNLVSGSSFVNHEFHYFSYEIERFIRGDCAMFSEEEFRKNLINKISAQLDLIILKYQNVAKEYTSIRRVISEH